MSETRGKCRSFLEGEQHPLKLAITFSELRSWEHSPDFTTGGDKGTRGMEYTRTDGATEWMNWNLALPELAHS